MIKKDSVRQIRFYAKSRKPVGKSDGDKRTENTGYDTAIVAGLLGNRKKKNAVDQDKIRAGFFRMGSRSALFM